MTQLHPRIFAPATIVLILLLCVAGAVIGPRLPVTLGVTPNTSLTGALVAAMLSRIPFKHPLVIPSTPALSSLPAGPHARPPEETMTPSLERQVMRKVAWRLVPLVSLGYLINVLDRFNISFAALTMNKALGLSATAYGLGAGAFFWSYVLFQVPANLVLGRLGARSWITIIMVFWGLASAGAALITDTTTFVIARFLLGLAEAGFLPGVAFFMTQWFPSRHRGRAMGVFYATGATAGIIGGPIAAALLSIDGTLGIAGWRWIFLAEGLPALALAIACPIILRDRPSEAT